MREPTASISDLKFKEAGPSALIDRTAKAIASVAPEDAYMAARAAMIVVISECAEVAAKAKDEAYHDERASYSSNVANVRQHQRIEAASIEAKIRDLLPK